jgi:mRNA-degrading endonuclease RelE of RelBE toxin-antitoxin system
MGKIRAIYEIDKEPDRIKVLKINYRGGVYK